MKKILLLPAMIILLSLTACGKDGRPEEKIKQRADTATEKSHIRVACFTWAENVIPDDIDAMTCASVKSPGNVAQLAQWIGSKTGGDLFSIQVTEQYPAPWGASSSMPLLAAGLLTEQSYLKMLTTARVGIGKGLWRTQHFPCVQRKVRG